MVPAADEAREAGNAAAREGDYRRALQHYGNAIKLETRSAALHSNRSLAALRTGDYGLALADAQRAVTLQPTWSKVGRHAARHVGVVPVLLHPLPCVTLPASHFHFHKPPPPPRAHGSFRVASSLFLSPHAHTRLPLRPLAHTAESVAVSPRSTVPFAWTHLRCQAYFRLGEVYATTDNMDKAVIAYQQGV